MEDGTDKSKRNRSAAYPSSSLAEAVEQLKLIHNDLGKGPYDRGSAAKSIGYNSVSGASSSKIAALVHYGLIQRMGSGYIETELGTRIALSIDQDEESRSLLEAFKSPTLFSKLLSDFGGKALPAKLEIVLVRQYRITEQASKDAAKAFRESAEFVGILKNGFLLDSAEIDYTASVASAEIDLNTSSKQTEVSPTNFTPAQNEIAIEIGPGIKVVFSSELMLHVATGKFSKSIEALSNDFKNLHTDQPLSSTVGKNEEDQS